MQQRETHTVMDLQLVERARHGDSDAFAILVGGSIDKLDTAARLVLRDSDRAKDAVQDALVKAWRDLPTLREPERFEAWLHRLLIRACYDEIRRVRRRPIEAGLEAAAGRGVADDAAAIDRRDEIGRAFGALDADQRVVVVLHFYLDLPLPEVARLVGIPVGTAKSRLSRALQALRMRMGARRTASVLAEEATR